MFKKPDIPPHYFMQNKANELQREGRRIIHLEIGEPDLNTESEITDEMCKKAREGYTHYGSVYGIIELREEIANYINRELNRSYTRDNIIAIPGSKISIFLLSYTLLRNGKKNIIILAPTWGVYFYLLKDMGFNVTIYNLKLKDNWQLTDQDLEKINDAEIDALIAVNPSNPTGAILNRENIKALTEIAMDKNAYIFADEIYFNLVFSNNTFYSFLQTAYEKAVGIYSFSKAYAMTGFRLGWIVADKEIITNVYKKMQLILTNIPIFIQYAGVKALKMPEIIEKNRRILEKRTNLLAQGLKKLGFRFSWPKAGFYIFSKAPDGYSDGFEFAYDLLYNKGVAVAPGTAFGDYPEFIRFSSGVNEKTLSEALDKIESFLIEKD